MVGDFHKTKEPLYMWKLMEKTKKPQGFANNPQLRLINPAKNEIGRISKVILDKINLIIREHFSQWKNTDNFLDWLNKYFTKIATTSLYSI